MQGTGLWVVGLVGEARVRELMDVGLERHKGAHQDEPPPGGICPTVGVGAGSLGVSRSALQCLDRQMAGRLEGEGG